VLEHKLSEEEHSQIVQTIEMFEAITQTQPADYQSLEILKEAYQKIGRHEDSLRTSRKLAEVYFNVGSYSNALQECEAILVKEPNAPEILAMLGEIETRLQISGEAIANATGSGSLINIHSGRSGRPKHTNLLDRGDDHLAKFLIVQQLFGEEEVTAALEMVKQVNKDLSGQALAASLVDSLCKADADRLDAVLSALIDRTKFAYVPLEYYDVDRQIGPMLPDYLTLGRLFGVLQSFRCCRTRHRAAKSGLHGFVVPGAAISHCKKLAVHLPAGDEGLSVHRYDKQIFRRTHR
jgi:tetratricopeptide (TPR) repeat protein